MEGVQIKRYGDMTRGALKNQYGYDWSEIKWIEGELGHGRRENSDNKAERRAEGADRRGESE